MTFQELKTNNNISVFKQGTGFKVCLHREGVSNVIWVYRSTSGKHNAIQRVHNLVFNKVGMRKTDSYLTIKKFVEDAVEDKQITQKPNGLPEVQQPIIPKQNKPTPPAIEERLQNMENKIDQRLLLYNQ